MEFQWYIRGSIDNLVVDSKWSFIMADRSLAASVAWLGCARSARHLANYRAAWRWQSPSARPSFPMLAHSLSLSRFSFHRHGRWLKLAVLPAPATMPLLYQPAATPPFPCRASPPHVSLQLAEVSPRTVACAASTACSCARGQKTTGCSWPSGARCRCCCRCCSTSSSVAVSSHTAHAPPKP
jgi:hypothetical protein